MASCFGQLHPELISMLVSNMPVVIVLIIVFLVFTAGLYYFLLSPISVTDSPAPEPPAPEPPAPEPPAPEPPAPAPITGFGASPAPAPITDFGASPAPAPITDFGASPAPAPITDFGASPAPAPITDFGASPAPAPMTDFGASPAPAVSCQYTYGAWSACSLLCGSGATRTRTRTASSPTCASAPEIQDCELSPCILPSSPYFAGGPQGTSRTRIPIIWNTAILAKSYLPAGSRFTVTSGSAQGISQDTIYTVTSYTDDSIYGPLNPNMNYSSVPPYQPLPFNQYIHFIKLD
jgi:hypothetical protein